MGAVRGACYASIMDAPVVTATPTATATATAAVATDSTRPVLARADPLWDGAVNARDLGGVGGLVQRGRLFRMGRHEWVTAAGWHQAWADGVRTVIDLRNPFELGRRSTDPPEPGDVLRRFAIANLPTEDQSDAEFMARCGPYLSSPEHYRDNLMRWPEKFAAITRAVVEAPAGVVVHCAAGRDRTGLVLALLFSAAGVPAAAISADYATAVTAINDRYRGQETPHETLHSDEELTAWLGVAQGHLEELLASLDARDYLLAAGIGPGELEALRARLIDPGWGPSAAVVPG